MKHSFVLCITLVIALLLPFTVFPGSSGKIAGRIMDSKSKELIVGVSVRVEGTTLGASSNPEGRYVILNVPPGVYRVSASSVGYRKVTVKDVRVSVDFTTTLDFTLEEGTLQTEEIIVQGERTPLIRKDLTNPVASVSAEKITELPVTSLDQIIGLQAGTVVDDDGSIHIRGGYANEISYTVNGLSVNNPFENTRSVGLATNAVQELSISSGTFNAEYGNALSGVVNYVTKDGPSVWTSNLKVYSGDHWSNRTSPFFNIDKINVSSVNRAEGTIGGPIVGDNLTFFASGVYDWKSGYLYGIQMYNPTDGYLSRGSFPAGDPRLGSSDAPYYFGPLRNPSTDSDGRPSGNGAIVAMNWSRSYNAQANLSWRVTPTIKLKYEAIFDHDRRPSNSGNSEIFDNSFKPDGRRVNNDKGWFHSVEWTHAPNTNFFYTVKGSYVTSDFTSRTYESATDPRYLPSFYLQRFPNTEYLTGGVDLARSARKTKTYAGKFDAVMQLWDIHELKIGAEVRAHDLENTSYTLSFVDSADPGRAVSITNALAGRRYVSTVSLLPAGESDFVAWRFKPLQIAVYVQDKIEVSESIVLNLGLRYEYFDPKAKYNPKISEEFAIPDPRNNYGKNSVAASKKHMLSPRISVSYPITDRGTIRFSYGHFYQLGSLLTVYENPFYFATQNSTPTFGNANVNPQKSIQYELGLQQGLTNNLKIEVTGYYKDVRDYIYSQRVIAGRGDLFYNVLTNLAYANTRGLSIALLKRKTPGEILSATIDYTFQIAEGNRTQPTDELYYSERRNQLTETFLVPFSFDRSHTLTSTVTLSETNDWNISAISYVRTGTPYTPSFPSNVVPITFVQNSGQQTVQWNVDLKAEKFFQIGPSTFSLFLQIDNLFDTQNETSVYANSGQALFNIEQKVNPAQFFDIRNRITRRQSNGTIGDPGMIPLSAIDNYYARASNLNQPRLVRLGTSIIF